MLTFQDNPNTKPPEVREAPIDIQEESTKSPYQRILQFEASREASRIDTLSQFKRAFVSDKWLAYSKISGVKCYSPTRNGILTVPEHRSGIGATCAKLR